MDKVTNKNIKLKIPQLVLNTLQKPYHFDINISLTIIC